MRRPFLPLGEWFRTLPSFSQWYYQVSPVYILQHLSFLCTWGNRWCAPPVVKYLVLADDSIYESLSPVGNLRTIARVGLGIIIDYV